jgi:antitoxin Xre/MbcA/ParS-like protein
MPLEEYARTIGPKVALYYKEILRFGTSYAHVQLRRPLSKRSAQPSELAPESASENAEDIAAEAFKKLFSGERQDWDGNPATLHGAVGSCINSMLSGRLKRGDDIYTSYVDDEKLDSVYSDSARDDPDLEPAEEHANRHSKARIIRRLLPPQGYEDEAAILGSMILYRAFNADVIAELLGMSRARISDAFARLSAYVQTDEFAERLSEVFGEPAALVTQQGQQMSQATGRRSEPATVAPVALLAWGARGGLLVPDRVADALGLSTGQLAETIGLKREVLYKAARVRAPKTQARMKEMLEIISRVSDWAGGKDQAMAWYRAQPIPAFGGRTAESLVKSGQASALRDYLDHIAMGGFA